MSFSSSVKAHLDISICNILSSLQRSLSSEREKERERNQMRILLQGVLIDEPGDLAQWRQRPGEEVSSKGDYNWRASSLVKELVTQVEQTLPESVPEPGTRNVQVLPTFNLLVV